MLDGILLEALSASDPPLPLWTFFLQDTCLSGWEIYPDFFLEIGEQGFGPESCCFEHAGENLSQISGLKVFHGWRINPCNKSGSVFTYQGEMKHIIRFCSIKCCLLIFTICSMSRANLSQVINQMRESCLDYKKLVMDAFTSQHFQTCFVCYFVVFIYTTTALWQKMRNVLGCFWGSFWQGCDH